MLLEVVTLLEAEGHERVWMEIRCLGACKLPGDKKSCRATKRAVGQQKLSKIVSYLVVG